MRRLMMKVKKGMCVCVCARARACRLVDEGEEGQAACNMYVCMYVCMYVYVRMYVCMYVCIWCLVDEGEEGQAAQLDHVEELERLRL